MIETDSDNEAHVIHYEDSNNPGDWMTIGCFTNKAEAKDWLIYLRDHRCRGCDIKWLAHGEVMEVTNSFGSVAQFMVRRFQTPTRFLANWVANEEEAKHE